MKYLRLHFSYLFNKINLIFIALIYLLFIGYSLLLKSVANDAIFSIIRDKGIDALNENYAIFFRIFVVFFLAYLWGSFFTKENNNYHLLILDPKRNKIVFLFDKVLFLVFFSFFFIISLLILSLLINQLIFGWFYLATSYLLLFVKTYLLVIVYGLLSIIITHLLSSGFSPFFSGSFFIFLTLINTFLKEGFLQVLLGIFFPLLEINNFLVIPLILLSFLEVVILSFIY